MSSISLISHQLQEPGEGPYKCMVDREPRLYGRQPVMKCGNSSKRGVAPWLPAESVPVILYSGPRMAISRVFSI